MRVIDEVRMKEEGGAVLVIVALFLVALFGMVALVVDIGGLAAKRRGLVNASDSAALAAAISYARNEAQCGTAQGDAYAQGKADLLATSNVAGAVRVGWQVDCSARTVHVDYQHVQRFFFAQVLGLGSQANVRGAATALWGPAGAASGVIPIVNYAGTFQGSCDVRENPPVGTPCYMWWDNDISQFDGSAFGFMNLDEWNVAADARCPDSGSRTRDYIVNGYPGTLSLNYPQPTYVCRDSGLSRVAWENDLESQIGQIKFFPVNDPATMLCKSGSSYRPCAPGEGPPDKYNIIGFTAFRIADVLTPQEAGGSEDDCGNNVRVNFTPGTQIDLGIFAQTSCQRRAPDRPDSITNLTLSGPGGCCQPGRDYTYDPNSQILRWTDGRVNNVEIDFHWAVYGECGVPPANNRSAQCVKLVWEGYQTGGSNPGGGANLGLQAVQLIE
ncbi:MAG TPA: pilus assembly protein TadG-related protein [Actinomycetota bacterium]|nr:pilus assembly protein TadG-related protein [Actinomycetota bacterium]